ncbi:MAG: NAD-dependent epimerase/dehydratase family protein, partial [Gemmatimonadaceae bacterium]
MPAVPPLCLTGASGFVGRRVLARLAALGASDVTLLTRDAVRDAGLRLRPEWRTASFDLARPGDPYEIPQGSVVLHLASATGSAPPATSRRLNVDGTRALIGAARRAAVRHFVYVSSVAAGYGDKRWSHYAQSKAAAEGLVAACGLPFTLVRPTIVFGPGSPNQRALEQLATLALPLLPGKGDVLVQPIHVDDLAGALVDVA